MGLRLLLFQKCLQYFHFFNAHHAILVEKKNHLKFEKPVEILIFSDTRYSCII